MRPGEALDGTVDAAQQGRLPCPVRADHAGDGPGVEREVEAADDGLVEVAAGPVPELENRSGRRHHGVSIMEPSSIRFAEDAAVAVDLLHRHFDAHALVIAVEGGRPGER